MTHSTQKTLKLLVFSLFFLLNFPQGIAADMASQKPSDGFDEIIVKFNEPQIKTSVFVKSTQKIEKISENTFKIKLDKSENIKKIISEYQKDPNVEYVEPNYRVHLTSTIPNDPYFSKQWALNNTGQTGGKKDADIDAPEAWDISKGLSKVVIAIIDSGVDIDHPDLKNNIWRNTDEIPGDGQDNDQNGYVDDIHGWDFVENSSDPNPKIEGKFDMQSISHGTFIAGIASASSNNKEGIAGISWSSKIMPLRVINDEGEGTISSVVKAINYARENGAKIINFSFVTDSASQALEDALDEAYQAGLVIVAAAGNDDVDLEKSKRYPVCNDGNNNKILGVAALNDKDRKPTWSNYGAKYIDVSAPGENIVGPVYYSPTEGFTSFYEENWSGTSTAAPHVAGLAALILAKYPYFTNKQVQDTIIKTAENIDSQNPAYKGKLGSGRINAYLALTFEQKKSSQRIITGAGPSGGAHLRSFNTNGFPTSTSFFAYSKTFSGGVRIATGDVDGDGKDEIIVGAGPGGGAQVRVFEKNGAWTGIDFWPFHPNFKGGVDVACGDVDGDGIDEIAMSQFSSGQAWIKVYKSNAQRTILGQWNAYGSFEGGATVALGDVDGDGKDEVIAGAGQGGTAQVRVFEADGTWKGLDFWPFHPNFKGGVDVAAGDVDRDGKNEIAISQKSKGEAWIKVYKFNSQRTILGEFRAYPQGVECGANIDMFDLDQDNKAEIITGAGQGGGPHVRTFEASGQAKSLSFFAYDENFRGGVSAAGIVY
jgi:subtilisin family serine protease